tara:strand:+ start:844 stop:1641 length:798 start_codon:yes stop_codon:yes gene_type:complete
MAYTVVELPSESMESTIDDTGVVLDVITRTFLAYADGDEPAIDIASVVNLPDLPAINDLHPSVFNCKVKRRSVSRSEERNDAYNITYTYEYDPNPTNNDETEGNVVSTSSEVTGEFVDVFRTDANYPVDTSTPTETDISGNKIDSAGTPTSAFRRQVTYEKSFAADFVDLPYLFSFVGTRNGTWYQGFGPGTLLYLGSSLSVQTGGLINRTDRFLYDPDYHLRQVPHAFDGDLNPSLDENGQAAHIKWVQPFPLLSNFYSLGIPE